MMTLRFKRIGMLMFSEQNVWRRVKHLENEWWFQEGMTFQKNDLHPAVEFIVPSVLLENPTDFISGNGLYTISYQYL